MICEGPVSYTYLHWINFGVWIITDMTQKIHKCSQQRIKFYLSMTMSMWLCTHTFQKLWPMWGYVSKTFMSTTAQAKPLLIRISKDYYTKHLKFHTSQIYCAHCHSTLLSLTAEKDKSLSTCSFPGCHCCSLPHLKLLQSVRSLTTTTAEFNSVVLQTKFLEWSGMPSSSFKDMGMRSWTLA
jgi:hypothetical protein